MISIFFQISKKIQIKIDVSSKLIFIKQIESIGKLKVKSIEHPIYKIKKILIVSLLPGTDDTESLSTIECDLNNISNQNDSTNFESHITEQITSIKRNNSSNALNTSSNIYNSNNETNNNTIRFERKITDEIYKIFQDNDGSFYFSPTYDLTNSIERQEDQIQNETKLTQPHLLWSNADDTFFWNKTLLLDLIENKTDLNNTHVFIQPIIQGFIEIEDFEKILYPAHLNKNTQTDPLKENLSKIRMCLISRRSRYRLGTRFKRRGVDENGNVANFVETEQVICEKKFKYFSNKNNQKILK